MEEKKEFQDQKPDGTGNARGDHRKNQQDQQAGNGKRSKAGGARRQTAEKKAAFGEQQVPGSSVQGTKKQTSGKRPQGNGKRPQAAGGKTQAGKSLPADRSSRADGSSRQGKNLSAERASRTGKSLSSERSTKAGGASQAGKRQQAEKRQPEKALAEKQAAEKNTQKQVKIPLIAQVERLLARKKPAQAESEKEEPLKKTKASAIEEMGSPAARAAEPLVQDPEKSKTEAGNKKAKKPAAAAKKTEKQQDGAPKNGKKTERRTQKRQERTVDSAAAGVQEVMQAVTLWKNQPESQLPEEKTQQREKGRRRKQGAGKASHLRIIPLGGLEQIGMNITAFEYGDSIIVVDCGMAFPEDDMLGIDLIIPDVTYLKQNEKKVKGFFITHGHEDHIGALPYILRELNLPVYATRLTTALIGNKLREAGLLESAKLNIVSYGDVVPAGDFRVEFIKTNHSIQDAAALAIHTPAGVVLHTGDFKVDYTPVFGDAIDLQRFAELGKQGVLALMADSTNALRTGFTMSERTVGRTFDSIFAEHPKNRIIVATFASNVDRVQQIINDAEKYDRKVVVEGRSMVNVIGTASELGYIKIKEGTLIDISQIRDYPDEKTVLVTTGSQGESMAALSRMASGQHKKVTIGPNDVVVMSSNPIPGNEKAVSKVINELTQKHATVLYQDTHVSGHACQEELKLIYALVRPKFAIPVHGEYRHRVAQKDIAIALGIPKENALIAETGDVIDLSEEACKIVDKVQAGPVMVDGLGIGDVGNIVMHDRQNLGQNGIIVVVMSLERYSGRLVSGPDIVSRGFVYVRENEDLMEEARLVVMDAIDDCLVHHVSDWGKIKNVIRDTLSEFLWRRLKRNPVILPIISEV